MSFLDEVRESKTTRGPRCTVGPFLDSLDPDLRADVEVAIADASIHNSDVVRKLRERGYSPPGAYTLNRHQRQECKCHG